MSADTDGVSVESPPEPAAHCATPSCWNTDDLQIVDPDTNAEPVTLCWACRKRFWGISS